MNQTPRYPSSTASGVSVPATNYYPTMAYQAALGQYPIPQQPIGQPGASGFWNNNPYALYASAYAATYHQQPTSAVPHYGTSSIHTSKTVTLATTTATAGSVGTISVYSAVPVYQAPVIVTSTIGNNASTVINSDAQLPQLAAAATAAAQQTVVAPALSNNRTQVSGPTGTSGRKFDEEQLKKTLLNNNGRKDGWHLFLFEEDRKQVENIWKETIEFEVHFANFQREFNKMSQTTSTIGDNSLLTISSMWNSWKDNLLNRRQQMMQLQERTLDKLYQKIKHNYPLIVTNEMSTSTPTSPVTNRTLPITNPVVSQPEKQFKTEPETPTKTLPPPAVQQSTIVPFQSESNLDNNNKQKLSMAENSSCQPIVESPKEKPKQLLVPPQLREKYDNAILKQDILHKYCHEMYSNPKFVKCYNDLSFLRNEMEFLNKKIAYFKHTVPIQNLHKRGSLLRAHFNPPIKPSDILKPLTTSSSKEHHKAEPKKIETVPGGNSTKPAQQSHPPKETSDPNRKRSNPKNNAYEHSKQNKSDKNQTNSNSSGAKPSTSSSKPDEKNKGKTLSIKIQVTTPGKRKVTSNGSIPTLNTQIASTSLLPTPTDVFVPTLATDLPITSGVGPIPTPVAITNPKDLPRTNNIQVPIQDDLNSSKRRNRNDRSRRNNQIVVDDNRHLLSQDNVSFQNSSNNVYDSSNRIVEHLDPIQYYGLQGPPPITPSLDLIDQSSSSSSSQLMNESQDAIKMFIERERQSLLQPESTAGPSGRDSPKSSSSSKVSSGKPAYTDSKFFTQPRKYTEEPMYIKDLLDFPSRSYRPSKIVFIIRGLPGSGKSHLAKLIKEKEEQNNSLVKSRTLSLDDYFIVERESTDPLDSDRTRRTRPATVMVYEYDSNKENEYKFHLFKEFRRIMLQGYYNFVILDSVNSTINDVRHYYVCAIENNYIPYVIEMEAILRRLLNDCIDGEEIVAHCYKHNKHGRSLAEIRELYQQWELLPVDYLRVDAYSLMSSWQQQTIMKKTEDSDERIVPPNVRADRSMERNNEIGPEANDIQWPRRTSTSTTGSWTSSMPSTTHSRWDEPEFSSRGPAPTTSFHDGDDRIPSMAMRNHRPPSPLYSKRARYDDHIDERPMAINQHYEDRFDNECNRWPTNTAHRHPMDDGDGRRLPYGPSDPFGSHPPPIRPDEYQQPSPAQPEPRPYGPGSIMIHADRRDRFGDDDDKSYYRY